MTNYTNDLRLSALFKRKTPKNHLAEYVSVEFFYSKKYGGGDVFNVEYLVHHDTPEQIEERVGYTNNPQPDLASTFAAFQKNVEALLEDESLEPWGKLPNLQMYVI